MKSKLYFGLILLVLLFSVCEKTEAQSPAWQWVKSLSATFGIYGNAIAIDPAGSGDVYITGGFEGTVDFDPGPGTFIFTTGSSNVGIFIVKLNSSGNYLWAKSMVGLAGSAFAVSIAIDPIDGAIYTTGHFRGTVDFDPGPNTFNLTSATAVPVCSGFPWCGDIFISKLDLEGNFLWAKVMGGSEDDFGSSIVIDPRGSGDVYTTGQFKGTVDFDPGAGTFNLTSAGLEDIFISKLNSGGDFVWAKTIGGTGSDISRSIAFEPAGSGEVYTTGYFEGTVDFNPGADTFNLTAAEGQYNFISKIDSSGNFKWAKQMGRVGLVGIENAGSIAVDPGSGDVYTTGSFQGTSDFNPGAETFNLTSAGSSDIFISKLDSSGNFKWAKAMGGTSQDFGTSIAVQPEGSENVYIIGLFNGTADFDPGADSFNLTSAGTYDIFLSKLDSSGIFLWAKAIKGTADDIYSSYSIAPDDRFLYVTGFYFSPSLSFDSTIISNVNTSGTDLFIAKLGLLTTSVVKVDSKTYQINIYPNPATNELTIGFDGDGILNVGIIIFNVLGEVVYSNQNEFISHQKTIDISSLSTGIYFVELNVNENRLALKVVKE